MAENSLMAFCSLECRRDFRRALRGVSSKAFIKRDGDILTLFVRPNNLLEFGRSVNRHGLEGCKPANAIVRYLDNNKDEFIRFEHDS